MARIELANSLAVAFETNAMRPLSCAHATTSFSPLSRSSGRIVGKPSNIL